MRRFIFGSGGHAFVMASVLETDVTFVIPGGRQRQILNQSSSTASPFPGDQISWRGEQYHSPEDLQ
jgi:hypothetical protein